MVNFASIVLLLAVSLMTGATPGTAPTSPFAAEFDQARANTGSAFQQAILADDQITAQEYDLAVYAFLTCLSDAGYPSTLDRDEIRPWVPWYLQVSREDLNATPGATPITMDDDAWFATTEEAFTQCSRDWKSQVEALYQYIVINPGDQDLAALTYACMRDAGILPEGYSVEEFSAAYRVETEWDPSIDSHSDAFVRCIANPHGVSDVPYPGDPQRAIPNSAWDADIAETRDVIGDTSPFQQRILEDGTVDDVEYALANQAFVSCMADRGYEVLLREDGIIPGAMSYVYASPEGTPVSQSPTRDHFAEYDNAFGQCGKQWNLYVVTLRDAMLVNPENVDIFPLNLQCLHKYGLVPDDFGMADIEHAAETGDWGPAVDPGSMQFAICLVNPLEIGSTSSATPYASPAP